MRRARHNKKSYQTANKITNQATSTRPNKTTDQAAYPIANKTTDQAAYPIANICYPYRKSFFKPFELVQARLGGYGYAMQRACVQVCNANRLHWERNQLETE
jgi:hypothetical protein